VKHFNGVFQRRKIMKSNDDAETRSLMAIADR